MRHQVPASRTVQGVSTTITLTGRDQNGEEADPGTVTIGVVDSDGNTVVATGTATSGTGNTRTYALTASQTASVDRLTATWTVSGVDIQTTHHDIVGGVYATVAEIRARASALKDATAAKSTDAVLQRRRSEAEYQIESHCGRAFVPRFVWETLDGTGTSQITLSVPDLREIVWAKYWNGTAWTDIDTVLADSRENSAGIAYLEDAVWPLGRQNVRIGYRAGWDRPPDDLKQAAIQAIEYRVTGDASGIPDRAISVQGTELGNVVLATPGLGSWVTAVPGIDVVLNQYRFRRYGVA